MIDVTATIDAPPDRVWAVLADGWSYPGWVVGATHMRDVDEGWPAVGTCLHHSVGPWPLVLNDSTTSIECEPRRLLVLDARAWPFGAARIRLELEETEPGRTTVTMSEQAQRGPGKLLPKPVQAALLIPRNRESLARLAHLAAGREVDPVQH
jgi:uncharacterized protein YndB with AHSA1/START domain